MLEEVIKNLIEETVKVTIREISAQNEETTPKNMNTKQAAEFLGMSVSWVYQNLDILTYKKIGRRLLFSVKDLELFLKERSANSGEDKLNLDTKMKKNEIGKYKVI